MNRLLKHLNRPATTLDVLIWIFLVPLVFFVVTQVLQ